MRKRVVFTLLATLGLAVVAGTGRPAEASAARRAYFRAATADARARVAPFGARELPGGIVSAEIPPAMLQTLSSAPGLTFLGYEGLFQPVPIPTEELRAEPGRPRAAGDTRRPCWPPGTNPVGWGIKAMYGDPNLVQPSGGAGVKVGVIDTGVFPHLDIVRRLVKCMDLTPSDVLPACADSMNHGTLVASVIAADGGEDGLGMWGMAPEASIYSYRVCEPNRECWGAYVADAIYAAIADEVNIINMSLAGPGNDDVVRAAIDEAVAHNILVVVAVGNSPPYSYVGYPAHYPEVVSVGAIQENLQPWPFTASGVNDGDYVREDNEIEMAAPGDKVLVATKHGCWGLLPGTSLAAPMVTGLAAKLWNGNAAATRARLQRAARFQDVYAAGDDTLSGFGMPTARDFSGSLVINAAAGPGGTISPSGSFAVSPGATQTFTIAPLDSCFVIENVFVNGGARGPITSYTFSNVMADQKIQATFASRRSFTITATAGPSGAISPSGVRQVPCGSNQRYEFFGLQGCGQVQDVKVDGVSLGQLTSYTFTNVRSNHTVAATFSPVGTAVYTIAASAGAGGTISPVGTTNVTCGDTRTYTITPNACFRVQNVNVDGVSQGQILSYTFNQVISSHTIVAAFTSASVQHAITASAGPGGTISPSGVTNVPCGSSKTYTITPNACARIEDVIVDGVSLGPLPSYTFTNVGAAHSISATFAPAETFTIRASANGAGTISPDGETIVACGGSQSYTIAPSGGCAGFNVTVDGVSKGQITTYTFTNVQASHFISVTFNAGPFTITASASGGGTITPVGVTTVACGGSQSYTIAPPGGCPLFEVWVDSVSRGAITSYTFTDVRSDHAISVIFSPGPFSITASASGGGTITPSGVTSVACGGSTTYTITPPGGCPLFDVKVDGVSRGAITSYTFTNVLAGHTISATFTATPFMITASASGGGTITPSGATIVACAGSQSYEITPPGGCVAYDVKVDGVSRGPITSYTFANVVANHTISATFNAGPFTISAGTAGGGAISPSGVTSVACGGSQTYTIALSGACTILDVQVDGVSQGLITSYTFTDVRANHTISATFDVGPFTITASTIGSIAISPSGATSVACGGSQTYTITPGGSCGGYDVKVDNVSQGPITSYTFTNVRANRTIRATYTPGPFTINATTGFGGSIAPRGPTSYACGNTGYYTIYPDNCYRIQDVIVDGVRQGPLTSYTFSNVSAPHTILATFSLLGPFSLDPNAGPGGTINPGFPASVACGSVRTYTIAPADNCHVIQDVIVDGVSRGPLTTYTFNSVTASHTIQAMFSELGPFTIDASAGTGGTISPAGASSVACAANQSYTIAPDACHRIQDVKIDGFFRGPLTSFAFLDVRGNHAIEVVFAELGPFAVTASAGPGGTISSKGESSAACGASLSYAIAADGCHAIQDVKVDGVSQGPVAKYTFSAVTAAHAIEATFSALGPYTITASAGEGSTISPAGAANVPCGASLSYAIAPEACRALRDVLVDGVSVGAVTGYTFADVRSDHTIAVSAGPAMTLSETHAGASWASDGMVDLTVAGGVPPYTYAWSNGASSQDLAGLTGGTYEVLVTDSQGCAQELAITIVSAVPTEVALGHPAPNPSAGAVRLRYSLPAQTAVRLSVLDLQGREVAVLADGTQPAGWSWASWNGATRDGRAPGGVYFIRLQAGGRQIVQRFALVR